MKKNQLLSSALNSSLKPLLLVSLFILCGNANLVFAQNWDEIIKAVASDREPGDNFGWSVAISGDYAIVGAPREKHDTTGANRLPDAGSVYIFKNNGGTWSEVQKLVASDRRYYDFFGSSVAISGDYAIVGAPLEDEDTTGGNTLNDAGAAYIFKNNVGTWSEVQKLVASDRDTEDRFGYSVAISEGHAIVGAYREDEDTTGLNTLNWAGSAYIFKNNAGTWPEVQKLVASDRDTEDRFGYSVAISGDYAIVGAILEDEDTTGGNTLNQAGSAYIFKNNNGTWSEEQKLVASDRGSNDNFGNSVAISGSYAIIAAYAESEDTLGGNSLSFAGSAYIFKNDTGTWSEAQKIVASDRGIGDFFGISVAISGNYSIVGAYYEDEDAAGINTSGTAGSAYIFENIVGTWSEVQKIVASDRTTLDRFGFSVAISGENALVSTPYEEHDTMGRNSNFVFEAGSAYFFSCKTWQIDVQTACDSLTWIDGVNYTSSNNTATDALTNAAGCDSIVMLDLTILSSSKNDTVIACNRFRWNTNNVTYTSSGIYSDTLTNVTGCDSILILDLTINSVSDLTTTTSGLAITANNSNATYQWLDCGNNNSIIVGDTGQTYTATANGNYAVELTENGCVDTSACVQIIAVGIIENSFGESLKLYPNPTTGNFSIDLGASYKNTQVFITDITGRVVDSRTITQARVLDLSIDAPAGIYLVSIQAGNKKAIIRLVKE